MVVCFKSCGLLLANHRARLVEVSMTANWESAQVLYIFHMQKIKIKNFLIDSNTQLKVVHENCLWYVIDWIVTSSPSSVSCYQDFSLIWESFKDFYEYLIPKLAIITILASNFHHNLWVKWEMTTLLVFDS